MEKYQTPLGESVKEMKKIWEDFMREQDQVLCEMMPTYLSSSPNRDQQSHHAQIFKKYQGSD